MESRQDSKTNGRMTLRSTKWTAGMTAMLLSASMIMAACGGGASEPVTVATPVPTMAAPEATTEAASTPEISDTEGMTDTEDATATEEVTGTEGVTDSEGVTETEGMDDSGAMTDTEDVSGTEGITETEDATGTGTMTDTEGVDSTETMTGTEEAGASDEMTGTEDIGDSDTVTDTGTTGSDTTGAEAAAAGTTSMMGVSGAEAQQYVRASTLLDYDFENLNDEISGDLEDLLIDLSTGRVLFAAIEYGGILDLGDKDIVIPLNAFIIGENGELILNIDEAELENYPDVGNNWPDLTDPAWDDDVNTYWNETGIDVGEGFADATTSVAWASDILGHNVADLGTGAGSVLDILVNLGTGQAPYVIVDYGEGLDTDPYVIPIAAFNTTDWSNEFAYGPDFTPDLLESAPRFDLEAYPDGTPLDTTFGESIESAWNDLGFSNDLNNDGDID
jgi:hypothetical protein